MFNHLLPGLNDLLTSYKKKYFVCIYVFVTTIHRLSKFIAAINSVSLFIPKILFCIYGRHQQTDILMEWTTP